MGFAEGLASGLTVALLLAFPVFWRKEQVLFHFTARILIAIIAVALIGGMIFSTGVLFGEMDQSDRDIAQYKKVYDDVARAVKDVTGSHIIPTPEVNKVSSAVPFMLDRPKFRAPWDVLPAWFWICGLLLLAELGALSAAHISDGVIPPSHKADDGAGDGKVDKHG